MSQEMTTPYWSAFAQDPESANFTCVNVIYGEWEVLSRSFLGGFLICVHTKKRKLGIFMSGESPSDILRNGTPNWKLVAEVADPSFAHLRGVIGAQLDPQGTLGNLVDCPKIGVSTLFERVDKKPAVFRVDVSWENKGSAEPKVETGWATPFDGDVSDPQFALAWNSLQSRIDEQIDGIRRFMQENGNDIPWDDKKNIVGKYQRVDFVWIPAPIMAAAEEEEETLKIVSVKRGRPTGKLDSSKRTRGPAITSLSKIACMTTVIKLCLLFPDSIVNGTIAGLFTLTTAFLDFEKWKSSEPLKKKFKVLMDEVDPMLNDGTYCFTQDYSSELRQNTPKSTMDAYDQCGGNIRAWCAEGSKCNCFLESLMPCSDPDWYATNKKILISMGMKSLNTLLSAERTKKQFKGAAAIVVGYSEEEEDLSWNLLVEAKQELDWGREDADVGLKEYYYGMEGMSSEEMSRKANHYIEVSTGFEKVGTKLNEAISIFKESKRLKQQMDALDARKLRLKGELNTLVEHLSDVTDFCQPRTLQSKAGGAMFVKKTVDAMMSVKVDKQTSL